MNTRTPSQNIRDSADIGAQLAELRAETRTENKNTRLVLERVATAVDRLSAIEAQNQARDKAIESHANKLAALDLRVDSLEDSRVESLGAYKAMKTACGVGFAVVSAAGTWLVTKFGG